MPFLKPVWEMSCYTKDIVLASSFEPQDLLRLVARTEEGRAWLSERDEGDAAMHVVHFVHTHCHEETQLSVEVQGDLERRHRRAREVVEAMSPDEAQETCLVPPLGEIENLPGLLWAVAADQRPELERLTHAFHYRVLSESVRTAAFGSRDLFLLQAEVESMREKLRQSL